MAINDILAQSGDGQDFIVEIPAGNPAYTPSDILAEDDGTLLCVEVPEVTGGGGNVFIMSE
jgi:hypothetical protein